MQNQIQKFSFNNQDLQIINKNGEAWFIAREVANLLGYRDAHNLTRLLDDDEKDTHNMSTPSGNQDVSIINESGFYHAAFKSRKAEVKPFRKWVTTEVLPQIRKTGAYIQPNALPEHLRGKDLGQILSQAFATDAQHRAAQPPAPPKKPRAPRRNFKQTRFYSIETQSNMLAPTIPQKSIVWLDSQFAYSDGAFYQWQVIGEDRVYFTRLFHAVENDEPVYLGRRSESGLHNVPDMYVPRDKVRILGKAISWQVNANL